MWNANYDCLFFCINEELYDSLTPEQQKVVDESGAKAVKYERAINRAGDDEIKTRWAKQNGVKITEYKDKIRTAAVTVFREGSRTGGSFCPSVSCKPTGSALQNSGLTAAQGQY